MILLSNEIIHTLVPNALVFLKSMEKILYNGNECNNNKYIFNILQKLNLIRDCLQISLLISIEFKRIN